VRRRKRHDGGVRIRIDPAARPPASVQLRDALARSIASGRLAPGERIPTVRELAAELGLAPNTVAKAYRELVAAGYLVARGRHGTFVAEVLPTAVASPDGALEGAARAFAIRSRQLGASRVRALDAVRRALRVPPSQ
jgi:DNA-binding transcriptional regulator YhcF (GntR family)